MAPWLCRRGMGQPQFVFWLSGLLGLLGEGAWAPEGGSSWERQVGSPGPAAASPAACTDRWQGPRGSTDKSRLDSWHHLSEPSRTVAPHTQHTQQVADPPPPPGPAHLLVVGRGGHVAPVKAAASERV